MDDAMLEKIRQEFLPQWKQHHVREAPLPTSLRSPFLEQIDSLAPVLQQLSEAATKFADGYNAAIDRTPLYRLAYELSAGHGLFRGYLKPEAVDEYIIGTADFSHQHAEMLDWLGAKTDQQKAKAMLAVEFIDWLVDASEIEAFARFRQQPAHI